MKDLSVKKIVLCSLAFIVAVFTLAGPGFDLLHARVAGAAVGAGGYNIIAQIGKVELIPADIATLIFTFFMMFFGIVTVILVPVSLIRFDSQKNKIVCRTTSIVGTLLSFAYMVCGASYVSIANNSYLTTIAFIPFLIIVLMTIASAVCEMKLPEKALSFGRTSLQGEAAEELAPTSAYPAAFPPASEVPHASRTVEQQNASIDLLEKYKRLLDNGVITQEEFERKKKELL